MNQDSNRKIDKYVKEPGVKDFTEDPDNTNISTFLLSRKLKRNNNVQFKDEIQFGPQPSPPASSSNSSQKSSKHKRVEQFTDDGFQFGPNPSPPTVKFCCSNHVPHQKLTSADLSKLSSNFDDEAKFKERLKEKFNVDPDFVNFSEFVKDMFGTSDSSDIPLFETKSSSGAGGGRLSTGVLSTVNVVTNRTFDDISRDKDITTKNQVNKVTALNNLNKSKENIQTHFNTKQKKEPNLSEAYDKLQLSQKKMHESFEFADDISTSSEQSSAYSSSSNNHYINLKNYSYCPTCDQSLKKVTGKKRSDRELKESVLQMSLNDLLEHPCSDTCKFKGQGSNCLATVSMGDANKMQIDFCGEKNEGVNSSKERHKKVFDLLKKFHIDQKNFKFRIGATDVCERALLLLLGIVKPNQTTPGSQYNTLKSKVMNGADYNDTKIKDAAFKKANDKRYLKSQHAEDYIRYIATLNADSCPTDEDVLVLPYDSINEFYQEYVAYSHADLMNDCAGRETFRLKFNELREYRLCESKGSFPTCDICRNANDLLRDRSIKDQRHREIILKFKRLHLFQQMQERSYLQTNRMEAANLFIDGQPVQTVVMIDAMTNSRGDTPQLGGNHNQAKSEVNGKITNRVIGVEVVCGPIDEVFYYHTDNLIPGGANIMCQILLEVLNDLSKRLATKGLNLPRKLIFQSDNCGENKNQYMFGMISHLVEKLYFDEVHCNFLLVGHTHCSIDQNFGVLTGVIREERFIGSPLSLQDLLQTAHSEKNRRPTVNRQIRIVYDFVEFFTPLLNKSISMIRIPHCFRFKRILSKCVMQYRLFSSHKTYLPEMPEDINITNEENLFSHPADLPIESHFSIIDGEKTLRKEFGFDKQLVDSDFETMKLHETYKKIEPQMKDLSLKAIDQQEQRMTFEEVYGGRKNLEILGGFQSTNSSKKRVEDILKSISTKNKGFIIWLMNRKADMQHNHSPNMTITLKVLEDLVCELENISDNTDPDADENDEFKTQVQNGTFTHKKTKKLADPRKKIAFLKTGFREIKATAQSVKRNIKSGLYQTSERNDFVHGNNGRKVLNTREVFFYKQREEFPRMIDEYIELIKNEPPFEWIKTDFLTEAALALIEKRKLQAIKDTANLQLIAEALLIKKSHNKQDGEKIMNGETKAPKSPKAKTSKSSKTDNNAEVKEATIPTRVLCSVKECTQLAATVCNCTESLDSETNQPLKCKAPGIYFCDLMHGPQCNKHSNGIELKDVDESDIIIESIENAKKKRDKAKKKKKEKKEKMKKNVEEFNEKISVQLEKMTVQSSKKEEERERIVRNNQKNVNRMDASLGIAEDVVIIDDIIDDNNKQEKKRKKSKKSKKDNHLETNNADVHYSYTSSSTGIVPIDVVISPIKNDIINNVEEQIAIQNYSSSHANGCDSAPAYTNLRSTTAINLPELVIPLTDLRCNNYAYHLLQTAFNGKNEPSVSFMETFNHCQYARWLPDLLVMYDIQIEKIQPVFTMILTVSENNTSLSEDCLSFVRSALKTKKIRQHFLNVIYNYIISLNDV